VLTVHHLGKSQSELIVWLCEELTIPYDLKIYDRDSVTMLAPAQYKALHPLGAAPIITDGEIALAESAAIVDYIIATHGGGRLSVTPGEAGYADFLYWFHFVNGTLQPAFGRNMVLKRGGVASDSPVMIAMSDRLRLALGMVEQRLARNAYLAGEALTAADIMMVFTLTTMRYFTPYDLTDYPAILAYLQRISEREAYRAAMAKGDPDMPLLLT
jgi:glutathione S-transferase